RRQLGRPTNGIDLGLGAKLARPRRAGHDRYRDHGLLVAVHRHLSIGPRPRVAAPRRPSVAWRRPGAAPQSIGAGLRSALYPCCRVAARRLGWTDLATLSPRLLQHRAAGPGARIPLLWLRLVNATVLHCGDPQITGGTAQRTVHLDRGTSRDF